jgi:hypothetical protein
MTRALRALLAGSIDYAGLFPPAKLPLEPAAANFVSYARHADAWMLGKFVCPTTKLAELAALLPGPIHGRLPWGVSALGRGGETVTAWLDGMKEDLALIGQQSRDVLTVGALEVRLPAEAFTTPDGVHRCLKAFPRPGGGLFVEVPAGPGFLDRTRATLPELAKLGFGFKLRCGGLEAAAFPESAVVAEVLAGAVTEEVPLKATAGLHHPIRRKDEALGAWMHGFVNLFVAALFASAENFSAETLIDILDDRDPASFHFSDDGLSWRGHGLALDAIDSGRRNVILSFGSCSFDEPRDDLRQLGWLGGAP